MTTNIKVDDRAALCMKRCSLFRALYDFAYIVYIIIYHIIRY